MRGNRGFTLIEVIVVAAIIAILAGILVPMIFNQVDEARVTRAQAECKTISSAILMFRKDTGKWPYMMPDDPACAAYYTTIQTAGLPESNPTDNTTGAWGVNVDEVTFGLILNLPGTPAITQPCYNNKAGTYLMEDKPDPWGHKYIVNAANFADAAKPVWIVSAGSNGCLDTSVNSQTLNDSPCVAGPGDDVGIRIK